jgi:hypothetical protein
MERARHSLSPTQRAGYPNDAAGFASCYGPQGLRHWAPTRPLSRPSRQSATGPPGSYPDRTSTGQRRRAYEHAKIDYLELIATPLVFCWTHPRSDTAGAFAGDQLRCLRPAHVPQAAQRRFQIPGGPSRGQRAGSSNQVPIRARRRQKSVQPPPRCPRSPAQPSAVPPTDKTATGDPGTHGRDDRRDRAGNSPVEVCCPTRTPPPGNVRLDCRNPWISSHDG